MSDINYCFHSLTYELSDNNEWTEWFSRLSIRRGQLDRDHILHFGKSKCHRAFCRQKQFDTVVESARALEKKKKMMMAMMMMKRIVRSTPLGSSRAGCRSYQRIHLPFPSVAHLSLRLSSRLFTRNLPT